MQHRAQAVLLCVLGACVMESGGLAGRSADEDPSDIAPVVVSPPRSDAPDAAVVSFPDASVRSDASLAAAMPLVLTSPDVTDHGPVSLDILCTDPPGSPAFQWRGGPATTLSYALAMVTQGNGGPFLGASYGWVVWDMPSGVAKLPKNAGSGLVVADHPAAKQTSEKGFLLGGPRGPEACYGTPQTYEFRLYALSVATLPKAPPNATPSTVLQAIESSGAIVERAVLHAYAP